MPTGSFFPLLIMRVCFMSVPTSDPRPCDSLYTHIHTYNLVAPYHNSLYLIYIILGRRTLLPNVVSIWVHPCRYQKNCHNILA